MSDAALQPFHRLVRRCDLAAHGFASTAELYEAGQILGQDRALQAIEFALGIDHQGFNLFVLGPNGTGKNTAVRRYLAAQAPQEPVPDDWCYVYNFEQPDHPCALRVPAGQAAMLRADMDKLVTELFSALPAAFTTEEYQAQRAAMEEEFKSRQTQSLDELRNEAKLREIAFIQTPGGFAFAPLKDGEVVSPDEFLQYSAEDQKKIEQQVQELQETLQRIMRQVPIWQREAQARLRKLNQDMAAFTAAPLFEELRARYAELPPVQAFLEDVFNDVIENVDMFLDDEPPSRRAATGLTSSVSEVGPSRYQVNVMVDNGATHGAPVITEDQPRYHILMGRLEHVSQMGALLTDFSLIKPGALHRANGGYLILDARKLLEQPFAYEGLKHALQTRQIRIESLGQAYSLVSTVSLDPQPIPLDVKVILTGERRLYFLLSQHDPEFSELFKVAADFEDDMPRTEESCLAYAQLVAALVEKEGLHHFERPAVERVIEQSSRWAGDAAKLSMHMQSMSDLLREANYWSEENGRALVTLADVEQALEAQEFRAGRVRDRLQEAILRDLMLIDTQGTAVGQVNGLAVYQMGQFAFGKPTRITARVRMGKGEVIDIERQAEMSGPIHSKGVLILSGFLGGRYAAERPFALAATLVFEQSYAGVEGDSASSAELYALLSALAEVPIKQSFAVTGSVNQFGRVQAVGGVNEKVEGFFDLCQARGLTGKQGVLIPKANVDNLMLRDDVVQAAKEGQFAIYAIDTIDEGMEVLTGRTAGEPDAEGEFPEDSINGSIVARLERWSAKQRAFNAPPPLGAEQGGAGEP